MAKPGIGDLLDRTKVNHSLMAAFEWTSSLGFNPDDISKLNLIKGVALSEGELKSGEIMTRDNVIAGAGAMRASAIMSQATLDIDHHETTLPKEYEEKYDPAINDPYPPGFIIDAQAVENTINDKKTMQVEFLAVILNDYVYDLIKSHKIKGCSVVDYPRDLDCDKCDTESCTCKYSGSAYLQNTLILEEVPNSNGTWVDIVTEDDFGSTITIPEDAELEKLTIQYHKAPTKLQLRVKSLLEHAKQEFTEGNLEPYMTDGIWNNGIESITEYLMEEKLIELDTAESMAEYLFNHPENLSQYQLAALSTEDLEAWWVTTANMAAVHDSIRTLKHQIAKLNIINKPDLTIMEHAVPFGQGEVNYGERATGSQCIDCRWFSSFTDDTEKGYCALVAGDVAESYGCDKFEMIPAASGDMEPDEEPDEDPDMEPQQEDEMEPDEDGNCPSGYMLSEDGTMCIKTENKSGQPAPVPKKHTIRQKLQHKATIEKNPVTKPSDQNKKLDGKINRLKLDHARLSKELRHASRFHRSSQTKLAEMEKLKTEIKRLQALKKKF